MITKNLKIMLAEDFDTLSTCFPNEKFAKINLKKLSLDNFRSIILAVYDAVDKLLEYHFPSGEMCPVEPFDEMFFIAADLFNKELYEETVTWIVNVIKDQWTLGTDHDFFIVIMEYK